MHSRKNRAYVSVSHNERQSLRGALDAIGETLGEFKFESFIFVDHYSFARDQEKEMMKQAMKDIDQSQLMVIEASYKAIGIGVEAGYGKAKNKPIVYVRKKEAEHSTAVSGISDMHIIYDSISDLRLKLSEALKSMQAHSLL